jgi:hypothetical protein
MKERTIYIADDGTEFGVFEACVLHELKLDSDMVEFRSWYTNNSAMIINSTIDVNVMVTWLIVNKDKMRLVIGKG